ncbi:MAG: glycine oxidase [Nitrospinae bacterium CG11_big_fil_rev_8_21_14_0_20_45_15]|nr:MAG: glycine oxidase [Nitrospinae bacterium CG11_big_fil_rev_8_21_14_0_20_45_15]
MERKYDVVIIGAGVIGFSIAFRLKCLKPNLSVAVLGDPVNSLMASRAAAGMLAPYGECEKADRFFEFCRESLGKYPKFISELEDRAGESVYFSQAGSLIPSAYFEGRWDKQISFFDSQKIPYEIWEPAEVRTKAPALSTTCGKVLWVPEAQVNNRQMHSALSKASRSMGVSVMNESVTGFRLTDNAITATLTDAGEVQGGIYVLSAGSWSAQLGKILNISLPIKPIKGQMCRVAVEDNCLKYTVHGMLTYIAPWREGLGYVIGSTMEDRGFDPAIEEETIQALIDKAAEIVPCIKSAPLLETWTGFRPAPEDLSPIMGKSGRYKNLFISSGHFRNGILQTPNQADYMAGLILESGVKEISEFSPSRYKL